MEAVIHFFRDLLGVDPVTYYLLSVAVAVVCFLGLIVLLLWSDR